MLWLISSRGGAQDAKQILAYVKAEAVGDALATRGGGRDTNRHIGRSESRRNNLCSCLHASRGGALDTK